MRLLDQRQLHRLLSLSQRFSYGYSSTQLPGGFVRLARSPSGLRLTYRESGGHRLQLLGEWQDGSRQRMNWRLVEHGGSRWSLLRQAQARRLPQRVSQDLERALDHLERLAASGPAS